LSRENGFFDVRDAEPKLTMKKPNILFLFSDQQRWDTCGCYGQPLPVTPHLDQLSAEGVCFEHSYTCQPVCGPARACLQTGKYATEVGCEVNHRMLPPTEKTMAHYLTEQGYATGYIGKWHLASFGPKNGPDCFRIRAVPPERRGGYEYWLAADALECTSHGYDGHMFDGDGKRRDFPEGRYRADAQTDWVIEYLESRAGKENPFFLFVSYIEPHHQNDHNHYEGPHGSKERFKDFVVPGDLEGAEGNWREEYPDYLGCIHSLDQNVGRIQATLRKIGLEENTLIIYTSDHGSHFRTRNSEYKRSCHDASIRTPLIVRGPGFPCGKRVKNMVSLLDLPPTVLKAAGREPPADYRGRPLQDLVAGEAMDWPEDVFVQLSEAGCGRALRTPKWKYSILAVDKPRDAPSSDVYEEAFLYDLEADPHERNNRVGDPALRHVRENLAKRLIERMSGAGEEPPEIRGHVPPV
jgi:arylsulfatase A-like enzyme